MGIGPDPEINFGKPVAKVRLALGADVAILEVFLEVRDIYDLASLERGVGRSGSEEGWVVVGAVACANELVIRSDNKTGKIRTYLRLDGARRLQWQSQSQL